MKFLTSKKQALLAILVAALAVTVGSGANAAATDYTSLISSIDFTGAITAILAAFAAVAGVIVVVTGGKFVISAIRGR